MSNKYLIEARNLRKTFDGKNKGLKKLFKGNDAKVYAVDNVTFTLEKKEIIGLIGESGCGKSTTAKLLLKLLEMDEGELFFKGSSINKITKEELSNYRRKMQIVFQDPYEYLNPRMNILNIISEPLVINKMIKTEKDKINLVIDKLEQVGLTPGNSFLYRYTHELSGGQRQRVAIARALILNPELIVADEPTSMLDASVRAGILNLLIELKDKFDLSMVFITHDISTAGYICDRIAVMYKGRIVEIGLKKDIIYNPKHPYTKALVKVAFELKDFISNKDRFIKEGEIDKHRKNSNCCFEERCVMADTDCRQAGDYEMTKVGEQHYVACCKCSDN